MTESERQEMRDLVEILSLVEPNDRMSTALYGVRSDSFDNLALVQRLRFLVALHTIAVTERGMKAAGYKSWYSP